MSTASNPGWFTLSDEKLAQFHPELYPRGGLWHWVYRRYLDPREQRAEIQWCLERGDCRAAVVVCLQPLLVAAYSDEFDAVVLLRFSPSLAFSKDLALGTRLVAVNNYQKSISRQTDFVPGPKASGQFTGFYPLIADFLTDDLDRLREIRELISEEEWQRAETLGREACNRPRVRARDGRPLHAHRGGGWLQPAVIILVALALIGLLALKAVLL